MAALLPGFPAILAGLHDAAEVANWTEGNGPARLLFGKTADGIALYVIDAPQLYERLGNPYHDANQAAYADNYLRFALLSWVAAQLAGGLDAWWRRDRRRVDVGAAMAVRPARCTLTPRRRIPR